MKKSGGYTLVELLIVMAIIALLSTVSISGFVQGKLQFSLARVANKFDQDVRRAQELALASLEFKDSDGVVHPVKGYGVYFDALDNKKYIIYADSQNNKQYDQGLDYIVEVIDFSLTEPGIFIKNTTSAGVHFNPPNPITTLQQALNLNSLDIVFAIESDQMKTKTVSIYTTGLVEVK